MTAPNVVALIDWSIKIEVVLMLSRISEVLARKKTEHPEIWFMSCGLDWNARYKHFSPLYEFSIANFSVIHEVD